MVDRNDSFLREVDEQIRRDRLMRLWERYGLLIIAAVVALFLSVIAYQWMQYRQVGAEQAAGARFEMATRLADQGQTEEAKRILGELALDGPAGYRALARLRMAATEAGAGRTAEALTLYEALSNDFGVDELLRDLAALQAAMLRLDQADWTEMKNRLTPLVDPSRPWHAPAREMLGLAAFKAGRTEEAIELFEQMLGDRVATGGLSRRAQEMLAILNDAAAGAAASATTAPNAASGTADAAKDGTVPVGNGGPATGN